jgi:hypothetical protein
VADTSRLWGGTLDGIRLDPTKRLLEADVSVLDGEVSATWTMRLTDVSEVRVSRPDEAAWDYTEVTEVYVHASAATTQVELVFCAHFLVSLPYTYGPDLEQCSWETGHLRVLALMPITAAERSYKIENGVEALEQRLGDAAIDFANPLRRSVV